MLNNEPSLDQLDDYNGNESPEKRRTIRNVIIGILVIGAIYGVFRYNYYTVNDYVGTPEKPGINTTKDY